jgi:hypothetical protein
VLVETMNKLRKKYLKLLCDWTQRNTIFYGQNFSFILFYWHITKV